MYLCEKISFNLKYLFLLRLFYIIMLRINNVKKYLTNNNPENALKSIKKYKHLINILKKMAIQKGQLR